MSIPPGSSASTSACSTPGNACPRPRARSAWDCRLPAAPGAVRLGLPLARGPQHAYLCPMRGAGRFTGGFLRFAVIICALALILLFFASGWNAVWIAVLFFLAVLLRDAPWKVDGTPESGFASVSRLHAPRAPPSA
jgi:hypothetical protein